MLKKHLFSALVAALAMACMVNTSFADADPTARARAASAGSQANRAEGKADSATTAAATAKAKADKAETDAANADAKAQQAKAEAIAVGTSLGNTIATKEVALRNAISAARGSAFAGDRALERQFKAEAARIQVEVDELKKKAQHTCAAFDKEDVQKACLSVVEKAKAKDAEVAINDTNKGVERDNHAVDKQTEVELAKVAGAGKRTEQIFDHNNQRIDLIRAIALGCTPKSVIKDGATQTDYECKGKGNGLLSYDFKSVSKEGVFSTKVGPTEGASNGWSKPAVVSALTLAGAAFGAGIGMGLYPNQETNDEGRLVTRNWEGAIGGAALGGAVSLAGSLIWAAMVD